MPGLKLKTAATALAVSLDEMKAQCSVEISSSAWDTLLASYGAAATAMAEKFTGQAICPQTWQLILDDFSDAMELPRAPVTQVSAITYLDEDEVEQTLDNAIYVTDLVSWPARVVRAADATWPQVADKINAVTIEFVTGYDTVPADIKMALLMTVASWFNDREAGVIPVAAQALLWPYRRLVI